MPLALLLALLGAAVIDSAPVVKRPVWRPSYTAKRLPASYIIKNREAFKAEMAKHRVGFIIGVPHSGARGMHLSS